MRAWRNGAAASSGIASASARVIATETEIGTDTGTEGEMKTGRGTAMRIVAPGADETVTGICSALSDRKRTGGRVATLMLTGAGARFGTRESVNGFVMIESGGKVERQPIQVTGIREKALSDRPFIDFDAIYFSPRFFSPLPFSLILLFRYDTWYRLWVKVS